MKRHQILLFILSAILFLGGICYIFPQEGVKLGPFLLEFKTLEEVFEKETQKTPEISPEEMLKKQRTALLSARKDSIEVLIDSLPTRFYLPDGDHSFFDPVFEAFENADSGNVRIVHYGDSQIEEDRMTNVIRDSLQGIFGGSGQGMMPAYRHFTFSMGGGEELEKFSIYAARAEGNSYGPYGSFARVQGHTTLNYWNHKDEDTKKRPFDKVTVLVGNTSSTGLKISCHGRTIEIAPGENYARACFDVLDSSASVRIDITGEADVYGVLLDGRNGISMDNVAMRGCSGTIFTSMNKIQLERFYKEENVRLILMQFGGNRVPVLKTGEQVSGFCKSVRRQISRVRELAPQAKIVYLGPSDMSTTVKGKRQTYPIIPQLIDSLKVSVNAEGAAYWDIYSAMGGENSMVAWVNARPALAGSDHVHFTPLGASYMSEMFFESFRMHYEYYRLRKRNEE